MMAVTTDFPYSAGSAWFRIVDPQHSCMFSLSLSVCIAFAGALPFWPLTATYVTSPQGLRSAYIILVLSPDCGVFFCVSDVVVIFSVAQAEADKPRLTLNSWDCTSLVVTTPPRCSSAGSGSGGPVFYWMWRWDARARMTTSANTPPGLSSIRKCLTQRQSVDRIYRRSINQRPSAGKPIRSVFVVFSASHNASHVARRLQKLSSWREPKSKAAVLFLCPGKCMQPAGSGTARVAHTRHGGITRE